MVPRKGRKYKTLSNFRSNSLETLAMLRATLRLPRFKSPLKSLLANPSLLDIMQTLNRAIDAVAAFKVHVHAVGGVNTSFAAE